MAVPLTPHAEPLRDRGYGPGSAERYDDVALFDENGSYFKVLRMVGRGQRVLELGPATGRTSEILQQRGCRVVAVEFDPESAAKASAFCERIVVGDLDVLSGEDFADERFDVILAADVLEHLREPKRLLASLRGLLDEGGAVVASIPNVAHGSVRMALLEGRFPYSDSGLLDRTHLRFFTLPSIRELFEEAGFRVAEVDRVTRGVGDTEVSFDRSHLTPEIASLIDADGEAETYQFVVRAVVEGKACAPSPTEVVTEDGTDALIRAQARHIATLQSAIDEVRDERERLAAELGSLQLSRAWKVLQLLRWLKDARR